MHADGNSPWHRLTSVPFVAVPVLASNGLVVNAEAGYEDADPTR